MSDRRKIKIQKKDFFTIPNLLTYFRFILVPVFLVLFLYGFYKCEEDSFTQKAFMWAGIACVILAALTDFVDGKIARKYNMITDLGKALDPLADKMMQLAIAIVVGITYFHFTSNWLMWMLITVFVIKEISQFVLIYITYYHGQYMNGAKWYGKVSTFVFDVLMIVCLSLPLFKSPESNKVIYQNFISVSAIVVTCFLVFAWIMYIIECFKLWKSGVNNIPVKKDEEEKKGEDSKHD